MKRIPHVYWSRLLFNQIQKGNGITRYEHTNGPVQWGNPSYKSITDCSGWVNALLKQSYNLTFKTRWYASTYYRAITHEDKFTFIQKISSAQIGDFIALRYPPNSSTSNNTGHIMMINGLPIKINNQWKVPIMDQSGTHGMNDSRYQDGEKTTGLGTGYFRIYTTEKGETQGYSWSMSPKSKYVSVKVHPLAIGRLKYSEGMD